MWEVYFLRSAKRKWYYVGSTNNIERRIKEHNCGKVLATKTHVPLSLVYKETCESEKEARALERRIKRQRLLKEQIIRNIEM